MKFRLYAHILFLLGWGLFVSSQGLCLAPQTNTGTIQPHHIVLDKPLPGKDSSAQNNPRLSLLLTQQDLPKLFPFGDASEIILSVEENGPDGFRVQMQDGQDSKNFACSLELSLKVERKAHGPMPQGRVRLGDGRLWHSKMLDQLAQDGMSSAFQNVSSMQKSHNFIYLKFFVFPWLHELGVKSVQVEIIFDKSRPFFEALGFTGGDVMVLNDLSPFNQTLPDAPLRVLTFEKNTKKVAIHYPGLWEHVRQRFLEISGLSAFSFGSKKRST